MGKGLRRFAALLAACVMLVSPAAAELMWPEAPTVSQLELQAYVLRVNENLASCGQTQINTTFEIYPTFASLGVTDDPSLLMPGVADLYFTMYDTSLNTLELMVSDPAVFGNLAASCLQAAGGGMLLGDAQQYVQQYVQRVQSTPQNSFEEPATLLNGTAPQAYFAYYPNMFHDGVNWMQMTLVFPLAGADDPFAAATPVPDSDATYEGYIDYYANDDYTHLEVFATATPEPDSPAGEQFADR